MAPPLKTTYQIMGYDVPALIHDAFAVWLMGQKGRFRAKDVAKFFLPWCNFQIAAKSSRGEGSATLEHNFSVRVAELAIRRADRIGVISRRGLTGLCWKADREVLGSLLRRFPPDRLAMCRRLARGDTSVGGLLPIVPGVEALPHREHAATMETA